MTGTRSKTTPLSIIAQVCETAVCSLGQVSWYKHIYAVLQLAKLRSLLVGNDCLSVKIIQDFKFSIVCVIFEVSIDMFSCNAKRMCVLRSLFQGLNLASSRQVSPNHARFQVRFRNGHLSIEQLLPHLAMNPMCPS